MAIAYIRSTVAKRSDGKNAVAMAAYRSGDKLVDRATGRKYKYRVTIKVDYSEILTPSAIIIVRDNQWLIEREKLWNQVERSEKRGDAQIARELIIAIPRELEQNNQIALVREYVRTSYVERGMVADIIIRQLDGDNPHACVMLTMRGLQIDEQGRVTFGKKNRSWNDRKLYKEQRQEWDRLANQYLKQAGYDIQIDSRSYLDRGIDRLPQIHLGKAVTEMRHKGVKTDRGIEYDRIDWINNNLDLIDS
jgi:ATP-dependent exoDNAse (exonuclease V) alpha subunit